MHPNRQASDKNMQIITATELKPLLDSASVTLLDVRLPEEIETASLSGAVCIPLHELPQRYTELATDKPVVAMCHHGVRSQTAAKFLERNGYGEVLSLAGGIDAWSLDVDATVPRY